jgi:hypothetical protein
MLSSLEGLFVLLAAPASLTCSKGKARTADFKDFCLQKDPGEQAASDCFQNTRNSGSWAVYRIIVGIESSLRERR